MDLLSYSHGNYERNPLFYVYACASRAFLAELSVGFKYLLWLIICWSVIIIARVTDLTLYNKIIPLTMTLFREGLLMQGKPLVNGTSLPFMFYFKINPLVMVVFGSVE